MLLCQVETSIPICRFHCGHGLSSQQMPEHWGKLQSQNKQHKKLKTKNYNICTDLKSEYMCYLYRKFKLDMLSMETDRMRSILLQYPTCKKWRVRYSRDKQLQRLHMETQFTPNFNKTSHSYTSTIYTYKEAVSYTCSLRSNLYTAFKSKTDTISNSTMA